MGENPSSLGQDFSLIKCDAKGSRVPGLKIRVKKIIGNSLLALSIDGKAKNEGPLT
jgi:hypothetical protein